MQARLKGATSNGITMSSCYVYLSLRGLSHPSCTLSLAASREPNLAAQATLQSRICSNPYLYLKPSSPSLSPSGCTLATASALKAEQIDSSGRANHRVRVRYHMRLFNRELAVQTVRLVHFLIFFVRNIFVMFTCMQVMRWRLTYSLRTSWRGNFLT
jgi:hypothetical protein